MRHGGTVRGVVRCLPSTACCSKRDVYGRYEGRVIRRSDELRSCGISDGSAVQVTNRMDELWRKAPGQGEQSEEDTRNISKTAAAEG